MCQYKADGGRRCPIHRHDSLAAIKDAMDESGLPRKNVEKLFNELRREGRSLGRGNADVREWSDYMRTLEQNSADKVVRANIAKAREHTNAPNMATMYALSRVSERAVERSRAINRKLRGLSPKTGKTVAELKQDVAKNVKPHADANVAEVHTAHAQNLPSDNSSVAAFRAVESSVEREGHRRIQLHHNVHSTYLNTVGYDFSDGRLEVTFRRNPDVIYAYRNVPETIYAGMRTSRAGVIYSNNIRNEPKYMYESQEEAENDAYNVRCQQCGQFMNPQGVNHSCPRASDAKLNGASSRIPSDPAELDNHPNSIVEVQGMPEKFDMPLITDSASFSDPARGHQLAISNYVHTLQASKELQHVQVYNDETEITRALNHNGEVYIPVKAVGSHNGEAFETSGMVGIGVDPRFDEIVPLGNDSRSHLKCTCEQYRKYYRCIHTKALESQVRIYSVKRNAFGEEQEYYSLADARFDQDEVEAYQEAFEQADQNVDAELTVQGNFGGGANVEYAEESEYYQKLLEMSEAMRQETREREAEAARNNPASDYSDSIGKTIERYDNSVPSYGDDKEKFYKDYQDSKDVEIPYEYENVLNGAGDGPSGRRFGVELEFVVSGNNVNYSEVMSNIGRELYEAGYTKREEMGYYHSGEDSGWDSWSFEDDCTVDGEIVSPIMSDTPESWRQLEDVCNIIRRNGGTVNNKCGSHVHVSSGSYGMSTAKHGELLRNVRQNEDMLYRLGSNHQSSLKMHRGTRWCQTNVNDSGDDISQDVMESHDIFYAGHADSVNVLASGQLNPKSSHVEFRMWDGTLNPGSIQQQVKTSVALLERSEYDVIKNGKSSPKDITEESKLGYGNKQFIDKLMRKKMDREDADNESVAHAAKFFDNFFARESDRKSVLAMFSKTQWTQLN